MADLGTAVASIVGAFVVVWLVLLLLLIGIAIAGCVFWILMIIDVAKRPFAKDDERIVWLLVVILAGVIGAVIYYFVVKRPDKGSTAAKTGRKGE